MIGKARNLFSNKYNNEKREQLDHSQPETVAHAHCLPVETDTMLEVVLDQPGAVFVGDFELREPRHVTLRSYFPAAELGAISQKLLDENGGEVTLRGTPLLPVGWTRIPLPGENGRLATRCDRLELLHNLSCCPLSNDC